MVSNGGKSEGIAIFNSRAASPLSAAPVHLQNAEMVCSLQVPPTAEMSWLELWGQDGVVCLLCGVELLLQLLDWGTPQSLGQGMCEASAPWQPEPLSFRVGDICSVRLQHLSRYLLKCPHEQVGTGSHLPGDASPSSAVSPAAPKAKFGTSVAGKSVGWGSFGAVDSSPLP